MTFFSHENMYTHTHGIFFMSMQGAVIVWCVFLSSFGMPPNWLRVDSTIQQSNENILSNACHIFYSRECSSTKNLLLRNTSVSFIHTQTHRRKVGNVQRIYFFSVKVQCDHTKRASTIFDNITIWCSSPTSTDCLFIQHAYSLMTNWRRRFVCVNWTNRSRLQSTIELNAQRQ